MDKVESFNKESICVVYPNITNDDDGNSDATKNMSTIKLNTVNAASTLVMNNPLKHLESNFIQSSEG